MTPICPTHQKTMRLGKGGKYFCPSKMPDESWCPFKAEGPPAPAPASAGNGESVGRISPEWRGDALAAASLSFAAALFRGAGPEMADDALLVAKKAFQTMREVAP